jgi:hypothetical protein
LIQFCYLFLNRTATKKKVMIIDTIEPLCTSKVVAIVEKGVFKNYTLSYQFFCKSMKKRGANFKAQNLGHYGQARSLSRDGPNLGQGEEVLRGGKPRTPRGLPR